jgi:hypothetical protein
MPQFWIAIFFILLAIAELYQSIKNIDLPLPVYLGLGTILAVASNYQQQLSFDSPLVVREASRSAQEQLSQRDRQITQLPTSTADPVLSSVQAPLLAAAQQQDLD